MEQRTDDWHEARKGRVTASVAGAILGCAPYMDRADAMRIMVRDAHGAEREFKGNIATEWGTANEPGALIDYRLETTHEVQPFGFMTFEDWLGASPDGLVGNKGGVEVKCPFGLRDKPAPVTFKALEEQPHYYAQVQINLLCSGRAWWHFFQWAPNGTKIEVVYPDNDWLAENLPKLRQFHAEYLHEVEHDFADHIGPARAVIDTPEAYKMVAEWDELAEQIERATERKRDLLDSMVDLAGRQNSIFAGRKLTQNERAGSVAYARVVKEKLPELDLSPYRGKPSTFWGMR